MGDGQRPPPDLRYSTNTSSRRLRIIGRAASTSKNNATARSPAEVGRGANTVASPRAIGTAQILFHQRTQDEGEYQRCRFELVLGQPVTDKPEDGSNHHVSW